MVDRCWWKVLLYGGDTQRWSFKDSSDCRNGVEKEEDSTSIGCSFDEDLADRGSYCLNTVVAIADPMPNGGALGFGCGPRVKIRDEDRRHWELHWWMAVTNCS